MAVMTSVGGTEWRAPSCAEVLVVQRILAADEGRSVRQRGVAASLHRGDEFAERRGPARVAPREVVEQRDVVGVGADRDDVADRLVDHGVRHALGIELAVPRVDTDADRQPVRVGRVGDHDAVGVTVVTPTDQWSNHGAAQDLVVVAADDRLLRGDVGVRSRASRVAVMSAHAGGCATPR